MRVIAGIYRRSKLFEVDSVLTRSTKDRVKETMFNMIGPLHGIDNVLDAFAGSGALGIEAVSRGAKHVDFIENYREAHSVLKNNIEHLKLVDYTVYQSNTFTVLPTLTNHYDLIILDPPYDISLLNKALQLIVDNTLLQKTGFVVSLSHKKDKIEVPSTLTVTKSRTVGITEITFFEWSD